MAKIVKSSVPPSTGHKAATPCHTGKSTPTNWILEYVSQIVSGQVVVGKRIRKWYTEMARRIAAGGYKRWHFDIAKASRPIEFIELFCKRSDGKHFGEPIILDTWQKAFIQCLFGWVDSNGNRQFQETLVMVARKNGKTTLLSCIALYMLMADGEGSPECYMAATKLDQARLCYNSTCRMLSQSKSLLRHLKKRKSDIYHAASFGYIMPLCADSNGLDGLNSHLVIIDELHAITDKNLYEVLKQSMSAREQPILCQITTAGTVRENIFDDQYDYACSVVDGVVNDDLFLPILYELDSRDEWLDPAAWQKANPGLGTIKTVSYLESMVARAKVDETRKKGVLTKDFNVLENAADAWLDFDTLNNTDTYSIEAISDTYAVGGCDLSSTSDLTAATLMVRKDERLYVLQHFWIPEDVAARKEKEDKVPYSVWESQGYLSFSAGNRVDYRDITKWFTKMRDDFQVFPLAIGYDPWSSGYWINEMLENGFQLEPVIQGAKTMSGPMKSMKADLEDKIVNYNNNPVTKWCLSNTVIKVDDNENIRPVKGKNPKMRIDGAVSLIDAYVTLERHDEDLRGLE